MDEYKFLTKIKSPADLENLSNSDLECLCKEIRSKLIYIVSKNGGHLASNLGAVELTVALDKVFNSTNDSIVWDVGHQCYTHKILTGRLDQMHTIRKEGGLSGFPKRNESRYDSFNSGHSSTSISAAFGIANANDISGKSGNVVAVIGDGALTGGLAYEGLNNAGRFKKNFIVVLNDNKMSISRNVGAIARYLAEMRTMPSYLRIKKKVEYVLTHTPLIGRPIRRLFLKSKSALRNLMYHSTLFEDMGFLYYGPFDGHDIGKLTRVFEYAKKMTKPVLIHVITKKGKGYQFAEENPKIYHGTSPFDISKGAQVLNKTNFSTVFGDQLCEFAQKDEKICAITAAMKMGTGLLGFAKDFNERFFDVGIAEEHAITFAAGLASGGMKPVFAVYSSFLQRGYDQIIHDAALQKLNVVLAIDRAGIVGEDGETHQGVFDASFLNSIPNVTIFAPSYYKEMSIMLCDCLYHCDGVAAIRYPRGGELYKPVDFKESKGYFDVYGQINAKIMIVTYGRLFSYACIAKEKLKEMNIDVCIIKLNRIKPIDQKVYDIVKQAQKIFFFEEGIKSGGIGEHFGQSLRENNIESKFYLNAIDDTFVNQASVASALHYLELDDSGMINKILMECNYGPKEEA